MQETLSAVRRLPDTLDSEEIAYWLLVINEIRQSVLDVDAGKGIRSEELLHEIVQWNMNAPHQRHPQNDPWPHRKDTYL